MSIDINLNVTQNSAQLDAMEARINARFDQLAAALLASATKETNMSAELDNLAAKVAANTTVDQSAITLLNGLSAQLTAIKNDPAKIQALADQLASDDSDLAAAVAANTGTPPATTGGPTSGTATAV